MSLPSRRCHPRVVRVPYVARSRSGRCSPVACTRTTAASTRSDAIDWPYGPTARERLDTQHVSGDPTFVGAYPDLRTVAEAPLPGIK